jgi:hypothetical protein
MKVEARGLSLWLLRETEAEEFMALGHRLKVLCSCIFFYSFSPLATH